MAISAEQLNIILAAKDREFAKAMAANARRVQRFESDSKKSLGGVSRSFDLLGDAAGKLGLTLSAGALATGMLSSIKNAIDAGAAIHNLAMIAGTGTTEFQKFAIAAKTVGIEQDKLADILKDVNDKFGDYMATGAGPLADFFENIAPKVGVTKDAFIGLSSDQALGLYVKTLQDAGVNQQEMTFYMEALASDATALNPLLRDNAAALTAIGDSAEKSGRLLDEGMIKNAKVMQDRWTQVLDVMYAYWNDFWLTIGMGLDELMNISAESQLGDAVDEINASIGRMEDAQKRLNAVQAQGALGDDPTTASGYRKRLEEAEAEYKAAADAMERAVGERDRLQGIINGNPVPTTPPTATGSGTTTAGGGGGGKSPAEQAKDDFDALIASLDGAEKANQDFAKAQETVNAALANGIITQEEADMTLAVLTDRMKIARGEMIDLSSVAGVLESELTSTFMSILDGTESTKDAFKSMARAVIAELYRVLVVQRLVGSIGTATSAGSGILGAIGKVFPALTGSASGGALMEGQASIVGEHGRELFVPSSAGRVLSVPQAKAAVNGGGGVTVVQNNSFGSGVSRAEIQAMLPKIVESTKAAVFDAQRRSVNGMGY
jgi:tetratricopeptide (TPR) repeat protein